jgi:IS605 OrfB family transposase
MNKVMKYQIYSEDKNIYKFLHELMFETRKIQNKTICAMYEWSDFKFDYKEKYKIYPKPCEILKKRKSGEFYKSEKGYIDYMVRENYYKNLSSNSSSAIQEAIKLYKAKEKDMSKCLCTLPYYKLSNRIILHNRSIKVYQDNNKYFIDIGLFSKKYKSEIDFDSSRYIFNLIIGDNTQKCIINRILENEYSICESELRYNKRLKKFFIYITYSFNQAKFTVGKNIMGIDMGIKYPVYIAIKDSKKRFKINGGEIESFRKQVEKRRYLMRKQRLVTSNRKRGRNKLLEPIVKIGDKIARFRDTTNHRYSKFIIDIANRNDVCTIIMENLEGINTNNLFLKNWSYYDLQQKIKYKAEEIGIKVIFINPAYASQMCSECGCIEKDNRLTQEKFKCLACGFESNADYNAALNIANYKIE